MTAIVLRGRTTPTVQPPLFDRLLAAVAPVWALKRAQARAAIATLRYYDAASPGRRTSGWRRPRGDANAAAGRDLRTLRELSRDCRRNNSWARNGIEEIATNAVGWGIEARAVAGTSALTKEATRLWDAWSESVASDYDGRLPFTGIQDLVMQEVAEAGECLVLRNRARASDGLPVPLRIRVLEADHLDESRHDSNGPGGPIVRGVEFDGRGRRLAYWLFPEHPGATGPRSGYHSVRVPAADVLHIYRMDRAGQVRGFPWLTGAIARLKDLDDYAQAVLLQQKIAACMAAFVEDDAMHRTGVNAQDPDDELLEGIEPGTINYLPPGRRITFSQPPAPAELDFTQGHLREIAAGLGLTYQQLTGDYSEGSYSNLRMGRLGHHRRVQKWRWHMLIPQLCDGVWRWVMELAAGMNQWPEVPTAQWSPPPLAMLEPDKEGLALMRLVRSGFLTWPEAIRSQGGDPDAQEAEIEAWQKRMHKRGIILDSDPSRTTNNGQGQEFA